MSEPRYNIRTWDCELEQYTPHEGLPVPSQGVSLWGVRRVFRALKACGYSCHRTKHGDSDPGVLIERVEAKPAWMASMELETFLFGGPIVNDGRGYR